MKLPQALETGWPFRRQSTGGRWLCVNQAGTLMMIVTDHRNTTRSLQGLEAERLEHGLTASEMLAEDWEILVWNGPSQCLGVWDNLDCLAEVESSKSRMVMYAKLISHLFGNEIGSLVAVEVPGNCTIHSADAMSLCRIRDLVNEISEQWKERRGEKVDSALLDKLTEWNDLLTKGR